MNRDDPRELKNEAIRLHNQGDIRKAVECLHSAIMVDAEDTWLWLLLASYQKQLGELDSAIASARRAATLVVNSSADDVARVFLFLGSTLLKVEKCAEAAEALQPALVSDANGSAHILLGVALSRMGRVEEAEVPLRRALQIRPANQEAMYNLAVLLRGKDPGQAITLLRRAIEIDPKYAPAWREMGRGIYSHLDDCVEAERLLRRALDLDEEDSLAHHYYAYVLNDLDQFEEAEEHWLRAAELDPGWAAPHCELGILYQNTKRMQDAEQAHRRAVELDPDDLESVHQLGWFLLDVGRPEEARVHLARALALNPNPEKAERIQKLLNLANDLVPGG